MQQNEIFMKWIYDGIICCSGELMSGAGMAGVTYYASNEDDPYVTLKNPVSQIKHCFVLCIVGFFFFFGILML